MVKRIKRRPSVVVSADGEGLVGHAGTRLVADVAEVCGLDSAYSAAMAPEYVRRPKHDPGETLVDLAVVLADGATCLSDLAVLRDQPELFGRVAPHATLWETIDRVDADALARLRSARARARGQAWTLGAGPEHRTVLDMDATLTDAHSDKEGAAPTYKRGYGFHPLLCYLDETDEALAGVLRPGNAGSNTAADHIEVTDLALEQIPDLEEREPYSILMRSDSAGATHAWLEHLRARELRFSVGFGIDAAVRDAIVSVPEAAWQRAVCQDGIEERDGAGVAELDIDLSGWPDGSRLICRREIPHDGAQFEIFDIDGYRHQCFITDDGDPDIVYLEARQRGHARVEDGIRCSKDTGLVDFPHYKFRHNQTWLELVLCAVDLLAWSARLTLDGDAARREPKRLRYTLLHVPARIVTSGRRTRLRLQANWPWTHELNTAFARLDNLRLKPG
ncbi:MAG: IS1380 family transposase [Dehalococcoidia bacterium]|nr:IS1380 family transposase [Dehalococcoidia bacterium]